MTETQSVETVQKSIRAYRHEARNVLHGVRAVITRGSVVPRSDQTKAVADATNGAISAILQGRTGLTQPEQVEHLTNANAKVAEARTAVAENPFGEGAVAEALATLFNAAIDQAEATLNEATEFASTRDFEAWQEQKQAAKPSFMNEEEDVDLLTDEDDMEDYDDE